MRIVAVCDIWSYSQKLATGLCRRAGREVKIYDDYRQMLDQEKGLDAVFVVTPDFWHARMATDALQAGTHVYCEAPMAHTLDDAASMVRTARKTGKLLQIGHQRRSNPWYLRMRKLVQDEKYCGRIAVVNGQWNEYRFVGQVPRSRMNKYPVPAETLARWGFRSVEEFYNWRWFKKCTAGLAPNMGSHQLDVFNWFLGMLPASMTAVGSAARAQADARANDSGFAPEHLDCTLATCEWRLDDRAIFGQYQVNMNSSFGSSYELSEGWRTSSPPFAAKRN